MGSRAGLVGLLALVAMALAAPAANADRVLRVGTWHGVPGQFTDVQAAINAAAPNDWVLVAPGDYHEANTIKVPGTQGDDRAGAAIVIRKAGLWLRGMNRNTVWIDGTKPGSPRCSAADSAQDFGPNDSAGNPGGRNGILIYKTQGVIVQNLSVCNFMTGDLGGGDEIWWDGGASTGTQSSLGTWAGTYLTATNSFYKDASTASAGYGIYSSNTKPPGSGLFQNDYASNMNDSAYYVGACPDCSVTLDHVKGEDAPQGYSGTNSGGHIVIENSEFDNNETGFATGDLNNDDAPGPQDGTCPGNAVNPNAPQGVQRNHVCWLFIDNYIHDNNNPNVPSSGVAGAAPVGTGITIYGGRHDVFIHNRIERNNAWGIIFVPFPDTEQPPPEAHCNGGDYVSPASTGSPLCYYDNWGNEVAFNTFADNGSYGNPSNGDIAELSQTGGPAGPNYNPDSNCFHDNVDTSGALTSAPANIDTYNQCGQTYTPSFDATFADQIVCASSLLIDCPSSPAANYAKPTGIVLHMPPAQTTMPNPCSGVPADPWCSGAVTRITACLRGRSVTVTPPLAPGERLVSFAARGHRFRRLAGHAIRVSVRARGHQAFRITFNETVLVNHHRESFTFTNVYRAC